MSSNITTELLCCVAIRRLQSDLKMLQHEVEQLKSVDKRSSELLIELNKISQTIDTKLQQLWMNKIPPNERELYRKMRRDKVTEFIDFIENVKQFGNKIIGKSVEKIQYMSLVEGTPLSVILQRVNKSLHDTAFLLACNNYYHPQCTKKFLSIYSEIVNNLMPLLSNADLSFCYHSLIKRNIGFIQGLNLVIDKFIKLPKTYSVFLFCQTLASQYPSIVHQTSYTQFSKLSDYLTGKLMQETDYVDQNSDIQPIAVDRPISQNQDLIKQMTYYIFKLIPNSKTGNLSRSSSLSQDNFRVDGCNSSPYDEDHQSLQQGTQMDPLTKKNPRKRGRKSK